MSNAGLFLRVHSEDQNLDRLRAALRRVFLHYPDASFASLFLETTVPIAAKAASALRRDLDEAHRLEVLAEITWHGTAGPKDAVRALGTTRRSLTRVPTGPVHGPHALDLNRHALQKGNGRAWLDSLKKLGIVHLGLSGEALPLDEVRLLDWAARDLGFIRYEAANWALPGHEARWLLDARQGHPILGIGPNVYGRWPDSDGHWQWHGAPPAAWLESVAKGGDGRRRIGRISPGVHATQLVIDGLRVPGGVDLWAMAVKVKEALDIRLRPRALERLVAQGRVTCVKGRLAAVDLDLADELFHELFT